MTLYVSLSIGLSIAEFANAYIMKMALDLLEGQNEDISFLEKLSSSGKLILILIFSQVGIAVFQSQNDFLMALLTQRIKHGINGLIFDKVIKKSIQRDPTFSIGEITNLTQVDAERIASLGGNFNRTIIAPLEIFSGMVWIYILTGKAAFIGLFVIFVCFYLNFNLMKKYKMFRARFMDAKDKRGKLVNEVFSNIRFIKMAGLENMFFEKIIKIKKEEMYWMMRDMMNDVVFIGLMNLTPLLFLAAVFSGYIWFKGNLTVSLVFTVIQIYNIFKQNFRGLPYVIAKILDLLVSSQRLVFFLLSEREH